MQINLYIDNVITGCDKENAATDYYREAQVIIPSEMFNLHSWSCNSSRLHANAVQDNTTNDHSTVSPLTATTAIWRFRYINANTIMF